MRVNKEAHFMATDWELTPFEEVNLSVDRAAERLKLSGRLPRDAAAALARAPGPGAGAPG